MKRASYAAVLICVLLVSTFVVISTTSLVTPASDNNPIIAAIDSAVTALQNAITNSQNNILNAITNAQNNINAHIDTSTVTNFEDAFPKNVIFRFASIYGGYELLDANTTYPFKRNYPLDTEIASATINTIETTFYSRTFVYQKLPLKQYRILGAPTISLKFLLSADVATFGFYLNFSASLVAVSTSMQNKTLAYLGSTDQSLGFALGPWHNEPFSISFGPGHPLNITWSDSNYPLLAINLQISAFTLTGQRDIGVQLVLDSDATFVEIPIATT